jgi:hypothetical protein
MDMGQDESSTRMRRAGARLKLASGMEYFWEKPLWLAVMLYPSFLLKSE